MRALVLDGAQAGDSVGERVYTTLRDELQSRGWDVERVVLREKKIGNCGGEFFCWIKHPGTCMFDDDNRVIAAAMVSSDLLVYLSPVTFGGYSSALKRMVDHRIQNLSPHFAKIEGETHHRRRYPAYPDMLAIGWMEGPDDRAAALFRHLAHRNAINFYAETSVSGVVLTNQTDGELLAAVQSWLNDLQAGRSTPAAVLPIGSEASDDASGTPGGIRRALLLVGSPKMRQSASLSLGGYLLDQLSARGVETETLYTHAALRSPERTQALLEAVDAADLVTLSFPLYVDTLPAPAIEVLERIAAHRREQQAANAPGASRRPLFAAIANSGFPEASQTAPALAICEAFARQAGLAWAGGLALGAGGMVQGQSLTELGQRTVAIRAAIDLAAEALLQGRPIPKGARETMAKPSVPGWMYRLIGRVVWWPQAKKHGAHRSLKARPYARKS